MSDRVEAALVALRRILRATEARARLLADATGLSASQLTILQILTQRAETTAGAIAASADFSQATITALLDKLETRGLVTRRRDEQDRRRIWVALTPAGRTQAKRAPDGLHDRFRDRFQRLPEWEQAYILASLEKIGAMLVDDQTGALDGSDLPPRAPDVEIV